jgi:hypothetical protein
MAASPRIRHIKCKGSLLKRGDRIVTVVLHSLVVFERTLRKSRFLSSMTGVVCAIGAAGNAKTACLLKNHSPWYVSPFEIREHAGLDAAPDHFLGFNHAFYGDVVTSKCTTGTLLKTKAR